MHSSLCRKSVGQHGQFQKSEHTKVLEAHSFDVDVVRLPIFLHDGGVMSPNEKPDNQILLKALGAVFLSLVDRQAHHRVK